jgi:hypothetical protein
MRLDEPCVWSGSVRRKACDRCRGKKISCRPVAEARDSKSRERSSESADSFREVAYNLEERIIGLQETLLVNTEALNGLRSDLRELPRSVGGVLFDATLWGLSGLRAARAQDGETLDTLMAEVERRQARLRYAEDDEDDEEGPEENAEENAEEDEEEEEDEDSGEQS